jgi:aminopeptidase YwaD
VGHPRIPGEYTALELGFLWMRPNAEESLTQTEEDLMRKILATVIASFTIALACVGQPHRELLDPKLRDLFHEALSGELAKEHVIQITRHHRIQGSRGYRNAATYVLNKLREYGFSEKDAYIESFKSDGIAQYQTWQSPSGWDITSAELRMVEPNSEPATAGGRIIGYPEIAMSVMTYSNPGDVTAELVWVGAGTNDGDYEGKDVKGKFVLATGYGGDVHRKAVLKYGAKAVVCYLDDDRAKLHPDMLQYTGMWPRTEELPKVTFGFNLTKRQGDKLKELLLSGKKVVLHGWVKGIGLEPYWMDVVVAHIRGSEIPDEELVFSAHLDHPKESANDNASGSGAILDIARTLKELIDTGRLPKPKRSFRFLWVPEWNGTMAYIDKHPEFSGPELGGKWLVNMNMDMVGENLEILHSYLVLTQTPASLPSCVNDLIKNMAEMVDNIDVRTPRGSLSAFNYRVTPYSGGSDHMMFIDRKIPGIMFSHGDWTHHTSEDTPDKVDPVELERCEIISAGTMWYLANMDEEQAVSLSHLAGTNSLQRMGEAIQKVHKLWVAASNEAAPQTWTETKNILDQALLQEKASVASVANFYTSDRVKRFVDWWHGNLDRQYQSSLERIRDAALRRGARGNEPPPLFTTPDNRIPVRLTRGPVDFGLPGSKLDSASAAWYQTKEFPLDGDMRFELVNFIDGKRTVTDIRNALSAEFQPIDLKIVTRYIDDLVKVGVVKWK